jgi:hypothetical protein
MNNIFRRINFLIASPAMLGVIFYFTGKYLQKLYGFDPPYIYLWIGLLFETAAYVCLVVLLSVLLWTLWRKLKKPLK